MTNRKREQLLGYLLGALEDAERDQIDEQLEVDCSLREQLADVEGLLEPLAPARRPHVPPAGLAARTCRLVDLFSGIPGEVPAEAPLAATVVEARQPRQRARHMSAASTPPSSAVSWSWVDLAAVVSVVLALTAVVLPAIQRSRMNTRLVACQENLRDFGQGLAGANQLHPEFFRHAFRQDNLPALALPSPLRDQENSVQQVSYAQEWPAVPLPVERLDPRMSVHPGVSEPVRGQNALFADGRVSFLATGPLDAGVSPIMPVSLTR